MIFCLFTSHESLKIRRFTWCRFPDSSSITAVSQQWQHLTVRYHLIQVLGAVSPFTNSRQCTTKRGGKKVAHLVTFLWLWQAPNMTNHISLLMNDCSTLLCSFPPAPAEGTWYKRPAYSDQWGGDLKMKPAVIFVLQAESKVKGN